MFNQSNTNLLMWGISIGIPAVSGLLGVIIGSFLSSRKDKINRQYEFIAKQLKDFYSPLLAIREEIKATGELRKKISEIADSEWRRMCARYEGQPKRMREIVETHEDHFKKIIEFDNKKLMEYIIPHYHNMIDTFRNNRWLAESSTIDHFPLLLEFVDIWDRYLAKSLPLEVLMAIKHDEESLYTLYDDLQKQHDKLRLKISKS